MHKKVYIKTYGCQMNERDSEAVAAMLRHRGYSLVDSEMGADVILLNTCSVRDMAEQKAIGKMGMMAALRRDKPDLVLGYLGCMAQSRGATLLDQSHQVDLIVGTQRFHHVPDYLDQIFRHREAAATAYDDQLKAIVDVAAEAGSESTIRDHVLGANGDRQVTGFVSIMQGCEMFCTFCIVPYTRGAERSRPIGEIVDEVKALVDQGVKEITLLGQIVTSYGRKTIRKQAGKSGFVQLLEAVHGVAGLERIRFTSPHPKGFGDDLVAAYRELPKLCEHAHLPLQSGSNRILKAMNRGYSREWYLQIIEKLRVTRPGIAITTDVIVGFPGESEADFKETAALLRLVKFDQGYIFKYSPRQDTPAAEMGEQVTEEMKEARHQTALGIIDEHLARRNQGLIGQTVEILVEGASQRNSNRMFGRTRSNIGVVFDGSQRHRGALLPVKITHASTVTLYGDPAIHGL